MESLTPTPVPQWGVFEQLFRSEALYENPLHEVRSFRITFTAPSGAQQTVRGFWNGAHDWRVRFMPDEPGAWHYQTQCSDADNAGLDEQEGQFECVPNPNPLPLYQHGAIEHRSGERFLRHADGTPFFYAACTAWNGPLKSTDAEWGTYLTHRAEHHYSAIQFVATQWRGCDTNRQLQTAYTGQRRIVINPAFFRHLDHKVDQINAHGLLAAPVLLWALPFGAGRSLSPGVTLPRDQAVLLAQYIVARYGGHHVLWLLGGDGYYLNFYARRWKQIGRKVFGDAAQHGTSPVVALHPMGRSWIGEAYAREPWLNVVGYQSGHGTDQPAVDFITRGPAARTGAQLPTRPTINMEPCYEELRPEIDAEAVRNASYWSVFATPPAGITYGANGIWPWIRPGERILNHGALGRQPTRSWRESIDLPGSRQVGYLSQFMQKFRWWELFPDNDLLAEQPGDEDYQHFVSVLRGDDHRTVLVYLPAGTSVELYNPQRLAYRLRWFDPAENTYGPNETDADKDIVSLTPPGAQGAVAVLEA
ncbi:MAG: DUF4038 domain-containing protein [Tunicatimonas sp.]